ncbi:MAG: M16 family metallopeptidase [Congregibacter sp.]
MNFLNSMASSQNTTSTQQHSSKGENRVHRAGITALALSCLISPLGISVTAAQDQDLTHPKAMGLPAPAFERPNPETMRLELDNGLAAYIAVDDRAPLVTITAYLGLGSGHGEPGAPQALAAALRRGPATMQSGAFEAKLASMFADYKVTQSHEETEVYLDVPASDAWDALDLMAKILTEPAFSGTSSNSVRTASSGGIDYSYSLDGAIDLFKNELFRGHRFGRSASSQQVVTASAEALHERFVHADNVTLAIAGDFDLKRARREASKSFAALPRARGGVPENDSATAFAPLEADTSRTLLLNQADRGQGWVVIGHELPAVPLADQAALETMDYVLGAFHLDSRLHRNARELRGLTNDNSSFLEPGIRGPGSYNFRTYGRPEAVRLLVDVTFRELELIRDSLVTADELFIAKGALVDGLYAKRYATGLDAANTYAKEWLRLGSHEVSASYPARVAAVSATDVQAAARKYIHPERMIVAVVGPLEKIRKAKAIESEPQLESWGAKAN